MRTITHFKNIAQVLASCRETFGDRSLVAKFTASQSVNPAIKNPAFIAALNELELLNTIFRRLSSVLYYLTNAVSELERNQAIVVIISRLVV